MISKKILIPMVAVAVIVAGGYGVAQVSAASSTGSGQTLAQRIAGAFGLDQSKVQSVIDQYRDDKQAQAESRYEQMLSQAVTDGKITGDQKAAILTEHTKLMGELQAAGKTGTDRRTAIQQVRAEADAWAKQSNLPAKWLLGDRPLRGMGPMMRHDQDDNGAAPGPSVSPSPSASTSPSPSA